jgi:hypothetical protein
MTSKHAWDEHVEVCHVCGDMRDRETCKTGRRLDAAYEKEYRFTALAKEKLERLLAQGAKDAAALAKHCDSSFRPGREFFLRLR